MQEELLYVISYDCPGEEFLPVRSVVKAEPDTKTSRKRTQDSDAVETGRVHCVIKNKPFDLTLGSRSEKLDLRKGRFSLKLVFEETGEEVSLRKADPVAFKVAPSRDGKTASVEIKISVLSSQVEGALFVAVFTFQDSHVCTSEPLKVVSKKSQLEKGKPKRSRTSQVATRDAVLDLIERVEEQQDVYASAMEELASRNAQQAALLQQLAQKMDRMTAANNNNNNNNNFNHGDDHDYAAHFEKDFKSVAAFAAMLRAFGKLGPSERQFQVNAQIMKLTLEDSSCDLNSSGNNNTSTPSSGADLGGATFQDMAHLAALLYEAVCPAPHNQQQEGSWEPLRCASPMSMALNKSLQFDQFFD